MVSAKCIDEQNQYIRRVRTRDRCSECNDTRRAHGKPQRPRYLASLAVPTDDHDSRSIAIWEHRLREIRPNVWGVICLGLWLLITSSSCVSSSTQHSAIGWPGRVDFEAFDGRLAFRVETFAEGVRVEDGSGRALLVLRLRDEHLEISSPLEKPLGFVIPIENTGRRFRVLSAGDRAVLFELHIEPDGDLEVVDENGKLVTEAKRRDYGFKILDANGNRVSTIRLRAKKILMRDQTGTTFLSTRDPLSPESAAALAFEALKFEYATALSVAIAHWAELAE